MTSLFVGNLSKNISEHKLLSLFKHYGPCKVDLKINKGPYAFVEYDHPDHAKRALRDLNKTNLNGSNGNALVRIEFSHKRRAQDEAPQQIPEVPEQKEDIKPFKDKKNICFICKLPGHIAKDCLLTKDMCYECGEKGHIAKECKKNVREAKVLTLNRVNAIFSQQSEFKFVNAHDRTKNIVEFLKSQSIN